jgi:CHAT domain-containing protein/tetratricopeptide (TPR) repeat protein
MADVPARREWTVNPFPAPELATMQQDRQYEAELISTPAGRRSQELLKEARALMGAGRRREALELFQRAVAEHPEDDLGAAAAAARHDLGHILSEGERFTLRSLHWAAALLRKALESPSRARAPYRHAQTENSLAVTLRRTALVVREDGTAGRPAPLLDEAERLYRSALEKYERCGDLALQQRAEAHLNLGNLRWQHRDDTEGALREYALAMREASAAGARFKQETAHVTHRVRLAWAGLLLDRGQSQDLERAEQLLTEALREHDSRFEAQEQLVLARVMLAGSAPDRVARAQALLARVRLDDLEGADAWKELARVLRLAEAPEAALKRLHRFIEDAIVQRARSTVTDFDADTASASFQSAASLAARIAALDQQDAVAAFLFLENTSGLRFAEVMSDHMWQPRSRVALEIRRRHRANNQRTYLLAELTGGMQSAPPGAQKDFLEKLIRQREQLPLEDPDEASVLAVLREAASHPVPMQHIQECVQEGVKQASALMYALFHAEPGFARAKEVSGREMQPEDLTSLLSEHPGHVLLRLDLRQDLLAVAVWMEDGRVVGRSTSVPVPDGIFALMREATEDYIQFRETQRLSELFAGMNLSAVLPARRGGRAVLLPSSSAARLPLAALGPEGARPIDRFDSIIWLPCLYPMRLRPVATPSRSEDVVAIPVPNPRPPGKGRGTHFHDVGLLPALPGERRLTGTEVTSESLQQAASRARILCIYTHGKHPPGELPQLQLDSGMWPAAHLHGALNGAERVEVWACQSGVHLPTDPLTPLSNEGLGLDFSLVQAGARTAIGTQWSVPDAVTGLLLRRYRQGLARGMDAALALAEAQRWWVQEGQAGLSQSLRAHTDDATAVWRFAASLGVEAPEDTPPGTAWAQLSPGPPMTREEQQRELELKLAGPVAWAGFRFVGVPGWHPVEPWAPIEGELTAEEQAEVERLLALEPPKQQNFDDAQEAWLAKVSVLGEDVTPTPSQALTVARVLRDRQSSSHLDNLLAGLAWLHEALAVPGMLEEDRVRLSVEAAHLWLEVALREQAPCVSPDDVALARAGRLLESVPPDDVNAAAARARWQCLRRADAEALALAHGQALEELAPSVERLTQGTVEELRATTIALELLHFCEEEVRPRYANLVETAWRLVKARTPEAPEHAAWNRLTAALLLHVSGPETPPGTPSYLTPRELRLCLPRVYQYIQPMAGAAPHTEFIDRALSNLESYLWGYPSDDGALLMWTTGTPGPAYRAILKGYLDAHALHHPEDAAHKVACLQHSADLRVPLMNRLARLGGMRPEVSINPFSALGDVLRTRRILLTALSDAALLPKLPPSEDGGVEQHPLDPYALSSAALREQTRNFTGFTAWSLGEACDAVETPGPAARTAAFAVFRASALLEADARERWSQLLAAEREAGKKVADLERLPSRILLPARKLPETEAWLSQLPPDMGVLGVALSSRGGPRLMACWNDGSGPRQRVLSVESLEVVPALLTLLTPHATDTGPGRGSAGPRREAWARLEAALAPALASLLETVGWERPLYWRIFAPGALRALPWLGIRVRGKPLAAALQAAVHAPSLDFTAFSIDAKEETRDVTACLLVREHEEGTTRFGEAAVGTLRRCHPPALIVDPRRLDGNTVVEVDALLPHVQRLRTLRLYGVGGVETFNDTTAMMRLEGNRFLRVWNTLELRLVRCEVVELWACTSGVADRTRVLHDDSDHIPGLTESFLANGAGAVIDLAWPVHDVVKALVCEQYGLARRKYGHGAPVFARALAHSAALLQALRRQVSAWSSARQVLERLDALRQVTALRDFDADPRQLLPFADGADSPALHGRSGGELVDELCQPVHLAAFRWWGG